MTVSAPRGRALPRRIANLAGWYRPESLAGTTNGATVSTWPDESGNGRHATIQGTGTDVTYTASVAAHGGRPGVTFASAKYLQATGFSGWSNAVTVFAVATVTGTTNQGIFEINNGSVNSGPSMFADSGTAQKYSFRVISAGSKTAGSTRVIPSTALLSGTHDGATIGIRYSDWQEATTAAGAWTTAQPANLNIGCIGAAIYLLSGTISELIIYSRNLTATERREVSQYLSTKYGIATIYNAANGSQLTTPTPDATGHVTHPDVIDFQTQFGIASWHGYRYYMLVTPFASASITVENPCLLSSNDGLTWVNAPNVTNPIDPQPGSGGNRHNDDPELDYDVANDRLLMFYADSDTSGTDTTGTDNWCVRTYDGTTVSAETVLATSVSPGQMGLASPAVWQAGSTWYALINEYKNNPNQLWLYTASNPLGAWTRVQSVSMNGLPAGKEIWHHDVIRDPRDGTLYMAATVQVQNVWAANTFCLATSTDNGLTWQFSKELIVSVPGGVQNDRIYRASLTLTPDATTLRCWYSAVGTTVDWYAYYTELPIGLAGAV